MWASWIPPAATTGSPTAAGTRRRAPRARIRASTWTSWRRRCPRMTDGRRRAVARVRSEPMCGIAGILSLGGRPVAPEEVRAMCGTLVHRGPDDDGFHVGADGGVGMRRLGWAALSHLFAFLATPRSDSLIEGVRKLEPGHILLASPGRDVRLQRYWAVRFEPDRSRSEAYFVDRLRELLEESVRLHLVSDVPIGAFLSGGVDSSSVVAMMSGLLSEPVKTFSIGFTEGEFSELEYARAVAERFGTDHRELVIEPDVLGLIDELAWT